MPASVAEIRWQDGAQGITSRYGNQYPVDGEFNVKMRLESTTGECYGSDWNWQSHTPDCGYLRDHNDSAKFGKEY